MPSALDLSPLLIFTALGLWWAVFLIRNYFSEAPYYTIRRARFYKRQAPAWFLVFTLFYAALALLFIALPIVAMMAARRA